MTSKHTTSIVDISEIEDDEAPLNQASSQQAAYHQQPPHQNSSGGGGSMPTGSQSQNKQQAQRGAHLYLFHEDLHPNQRIPNLLSTINQAGGGSREVSPGQTLARDQQQQGYQQQQQLPAIDYHYPASHSPAHGGGPQAPPLQDDPRSTTPAHSAAAAGAAGSQQQEPAKANLGTLSGVYFPCVQNIFGVILFIRMVWIVGTAGIPTAFALVFICCCVTLTTSISLSAIATNGIVPAGGSYFMISRSLGPECGGAVGTMFFLGTTFAGAMYITGAVEIMLNYLAPSWGLFGDFQRDVSIMYNNIRVYGSLLLIVVGLMVWIGVRFVSKLAPIALFCVLISIFSIYAGIFINYNGRSDLMICVLGDRLVTLKNMPYDELPPGSSFNGQQQFGEQQQQQQMELGNGRGNGSGKLTPAELASLYQLRRTKALCTYEKLRYIFCPNLDATSQQQQQQQQQQSFDYGQLVEPMGGQLVAGGGGSGEPGAPTQAPNSMADLFKRPPNMSNCDSYFKANKDRIHLEKAVPGIASGVYLQNLKPRFREKRQLVSYDDGKNTNERNDFNQIFVDITTSFTILISIYFPSCTGILAGSNRSGDLADAQKSIPRGTIAAQLTTSFVYLSCVVLFGSTFNNLFIRDKFGESMGGQLAVTQIAWPHPYIILMGGLLSTLGAALQSLVGAPRILQGIARDEVIPCFNRFAKLSPRGEPETAILFTLGISWLAVLIGNLDFIAPILTLSLVMCYFFINLACTLHSLLGSPNWRPRFRHYHWSISTLGCLLCLFVMIVSSWLYFIVAIFLASCIYKYIEFHGAEKEWGDGKQGLALSAARYNLLRLRTNEVHTKNWRPQVLLFCKLKPASELEPPSSSASANAQLKRPQYANLPAHQQQQLALVGPQHQLDRESSAGNNNDASSNEQLRLAHPKLLTFASQLKAGKGLTLVSAIIEGDFKRLASQAQVARATLQERMQEEKVKGFADVLIAPSIMDGLSYQIQAAGLGGLKHNTVIVGWPQHWRRPLSGPPPPGLPTSTTGSSSDQRQRGSFKQQQQQQQKGKHLATRAHLFIDLLRNVQVSQNSLLVMKGVDSWPESCDKLGGHIDIWWVVEDGGLLMLLPHLLKQHRTWKSCQLRIFTVAQAGDNVEQMRADLAKFLYHLRIEAQVDIVEMNNTEISDYAYERTLMMEQRAEIIKRLQVNRKQSLLLEQEVDGRLIRFRIRKPSMGGDFEGCPPDVGLMSPTGQQPQQPQPPPPSGSGSPGEHLPMVDMAPAALEAAGSPTTGASEQQPGSGNGQAGGAQMRPDETNVRRMHTALTLNEAILKRSKSAKLVILNLPGPPKVQTPEAENNYMEFIEIITDKLERVLLVQNGGREVITIHS